MRSPRTVRRAWHGVNAVLVGTAVILQLILSIAGANVLLPGETPPTGIRIWQFFSYFTIQSNVLVVIALVPLIRDPDADGQRWRVLRLASVLGISVTGLVSATLLRGLVDLDGLLWWLDLLLHTVSPIMVVLGWILWGPRPRITNRVLIWVLLWPVVWLVYTLIVGALRGWYPYPFLNPGRSGWPLVIASCAGITVVFVILAMIFRGLDRRLPTNDSGESAP